jgi:hypothetical protein
MNHRALLVAAALVVGSPMLANEPVSAATATAAPSATRSPQPHASDPTGERLVIASCPRTVFYSWPAKDAAPSAAAYPPATSGDAFHIVGPVQQTLDGMLLYETTIDVVDPYGAGKHYWVAQHCVNAG